MPPGSARTMRLPSTGRGESDGADLVLMRGKPDVRCSPSARSRVSAFSLGEYETAKQAFERGLSLLEAAGKADSVRKYRTWIRKCDAEIESECDPPAQPQG
jgi:hypothetical protein